VRKVLVLSAPTGEVLGAITVPKQVYERHAHDFQRVALETARAFNQRLTVLDEERCSTVAAVERAVRRFNGGR
jgi:hypothetical protein